MTPSFFVVRVWLPISKEAGTEFPIREENIETGPDVFRLPVQFHRFFSLEARLRFPVLRKLPRLTRQVQDLLVYWLQTSAPRIQGAPRQGVPGFS